MCFLFFELLGWSVSRSMQMDFFILLCNYHSYDKLNTISHVITHTDWTNDILWETASNIYIFLSFDVESNYLTKKKIHVV